MFHSTNYTPHRGPAMPATGRKRSSIPRPCASMPMIGTQRTAAPLSISHVLSVCVSVTFTSRRALCIESKKNQCIETKTRTLQHATPQEHHSFAGAEGSFPCFLPRPIPPDLPQPLVDIDGVSAVCLARRIERGSQSLKRVLCRG